jgi:hypothetical protein
MALSKRKAGRRWGEFTRLKVASGWSTKIRAASFRVNGILYILELY